MYKILLTSIFLTLSVTGFTQNIENHLQTEEIIKFDSDNYHLAWTTHPNNSYYKQEYLMKGQSLEKYKSMLIIDFLKGDFSIDEVVKVKIEELENAKKNNPIVNYMVYEKNGETILDFLLSANSADGSKLMIVERNVYRYQKIASHKKNGVLVFAISERAYEDDILTFLKALKEEKNDLVIKVGSITVPKINPKN